MSNERELRRLTLTGIGVMALGAVITIVGSLAVHVTGANEMNTLGQEIYTFAPRGWVAVTISQLVALTGALIFLAGIIVAFVFRREMTWARATIAAFVFTALSMIFFGTIPNEWLTLAQAELQWDGRPFVTIPAGLVGGNDLSISWAALKDIISGTYSIVVLGAFAVGMVKAQAWSKAQRDAPPPEPVSEYGRPIRLAGDN